MLWSFLVRCGNCASGTSRRDAAFLASTPRQANREATMTMDDSEAPFIVEEAMEYVGEIHRELTTENTAPPPGVEGRVVSAILAEPKLRGYIHDWALREHALEASVEPPHRLPIDDVYRRVRDLLLAAEGERARPL
jgi:hypothetical protein